MTETKFIEEFLRLIDIEFLAGVDDNDASTYEIESLYLEKSISYRRLHPIISSNRIFRMKIQSKVDFPVELNIAFRQKRYQFEKSYTSRFCHPRATIFHYLKCSRGAFYPPPAFPRASYKYQSYESGLIDEIENYPIEWLISPDEDFLEKIEVTNQSTNEIIFEKRFSVKIQEAFVDQCKSLFLNRNKIRDTYKSDVDNHEIIIKTRIDYSHITKLNKEADIEFQKISDKKDLIEAFYQNHSNGIGCLQALIAIGILGILLLILSAISI